MDMQGKITILGTGTSQGIPVLACKCETCSSKDTKDKRLRCSLLVESNHANLVIDVGPDFRQQLLRSPVDTLDAVFLTHEHNDHLIGLDDLRPYIFKKSKPIPIYAEKRVLIEVEKRFGYAFGNHAYPGAPSFELIEIVPGQEFKFENLVIRAERLYHGELPILGYIINDQLAYFTDTNRIDVEVVKRNQGLKYVILDMLREKKHHSHFSLEEAITQCKELGASTSYLIHMSHHLGPVAKWETRLPKNIFAAYDAQVIEL